jgi:hypothetical protein
MLSKKPIDFSKMIDGMKHETINWIPNAVDKFSIFSE